MQHAVLAGLLKATFLLPLAAAFNSHATVVPPGDVTLSLDTVSGSPWKVSGGGALNATPVVLAPSAAGGLVNALALTSTGNGYGAFIPGTSQSQFQGYWRADFTFTLPADAVNISLSFANVALADRGTLSLNGNLLVGTGIDAGSLGNHVLGLMVFTEGGPSQAYSFSGGDYHLSGLVTSGFNVGGVNTFEAIINNTFSGIQAPLRGLYQSDTTYFGMAGTLSYSVPEPAAGTLLLGGGLALLGALSRRRRG